MNEGNNSYLSKQPLQHKREPSQPVFHMAPTLLARDVRHKYGNAFPEGKLTDSQYGTWPTFRAVDERIGQFIYK